MNFGKRATNQKRHALASRSTMMGKKGTRFCFAYHFHLSDCNTGYRRLYGNRGNERPYR